MFDPESVIKWGRSVHRHLASKMLTHWQVEPDLAGLREPGALEALPPDEQKECRALWEEVAVVLKRAQSPR